MGPGEGQPASHQGHAERTPPERTPPRRGCLDAAVRRPATGASDTITSKIGSRPLRRAQVNPGQAASFRLIPNAAQARQPADPMSGHRATTVATTEPLDIHISQATESQSLRLDISLALTAIGGETGQCALAESRVNARTYFNGTQ
jgi:hypothetical protein